MVVLSIMARRNHSSGEAGQPRPPFSYEESSCIRATGKSYVCNLRKSTTLSCVRLHPGNQSNTPRAPCTASRTANREANFYRPKINLWRRQSDWWVALRKKFSDRTQAKFCGSCSNLLHFPFFLKVFAEMVGIDWIWFLIIEGWDVHPFQRLSKFEPS